MSIDSIKLVRDSTLDPFAIEPPLDMDEVCLRLHDELFSRSVTATRKSAIIFQYKVPPPLFTPSTLTRQDIFELQHYNVLTYGFYDPSTVSRPTLVQILS